MSPYWVTDDKEKDKGFQRLPMTCGQNMACYWVKGQESGSCLVIILGTSRKTSVSLPVSERNKTLKSQIFLTGIFAQSGIKGLRCTQNSL